MNKPFVITAGLIVKPKGERLRSDILPLCRIKHRDLSKFERAQFGLKIIDGAPVAISQSQLAMLLGISSITLSRYRRERCATDRTYERSPRPGQC